MFYAILKKKGKLEIRQRTGKWKVDRNGVYEKKMKIKIMIKKICHSHVLWN